MSDWWGVDLKQCSDPWQSSKRFKMVSRAIDGPVNLTFNVGNHTGNRVTGYTQQLGFVVNGVFSETQPGQGLAFALQDETSSITQTRPQAAWPIRETLTHLWLTVCSVPQTRIILLRATSPPTHRASFGLEAGETFIRTTCLSELHRDLFGEWLPADQMKGAYYFDMASNPYTDNALVASCDGVLDEESGINGTAANAGCDGTWNIPPAVGTDVRAPIPVDAATLAAWAADPNWAPAYIDDLANVNINAYVVVGDASAWPTAAGNGNAQFTILMVPTFDATVAVTEPGTTGPADIIVTIIAPTTVLP